MSRHKFFLSSLLYYFTVYLLLGVTGMMLLLTVFYNIPEFDISHFFLMSCSSGKLNGVGNMTALNNSSAAEHPQIVTNESDPERMRLQPSGSQGPKYTQQINETNELGVRILLLRTFFFLEKYPILMF